MCGRFTRTDEVERIARELGIEMVQTTLEPSYNVAPTQKVAAVIHDDARRLVEMRWGMIPSWAKDASIGNKLINARAETIKEKPSFRKPFKRSRCLVVADGFYEWQKTRDEKQPFYIRLKSGGPFAFAGLYDVWESPAETVTSCTIITTEPNELMASIHNRMPVILGKKEADLWLQDGERDADALLALLKPYPAERMEAYAVSKSVNSPRFNGPNCITPLE